MTITSPTDVKRTIVAYNTTMNHILEQIKEQREKMDPIEPTNDDLIVYNNLLDQYNNYESLKKSAERVLCLMNVHEKAAS